MGRRTVLATVSAMPSPGLRSVASTGARGRPLPGAVPARAGQEGPASTTGPRGSSRARRSACSRRPTPTAAATSPPAVAHPVRPHPRRAPARYPRSERQQPAGLADQRARQPERGPALRDPRPRPDPPGPRRRGSTDGPQILALWDDDLRGPSVAVGIRVRTVYIHCAKSFRRVRLDPDAWAELAGAPDICDVIIEQVGMDVLERSFAIPRTGYAFDLEAERTQRGSR